MINLGSWHDMSWPDDWTSTTKDGERSAQFEHCLLVTPNGCEVLTVCDNFDIVRAPVRSPSRAHSRVVVVVVVVVVMTLAQPAEALDTTGASRLKAPAHMAKYAEAVGVKVDVAPPTTPAIPVVAQSADAQ